MSTSPGVTIARVLMNEGVVQFNNQRVLPSVQNAVSQQ